MQKMPGSAGRSRFFTAGARRKNRPLRTARIEGLESRLLLIATPFLVKDLFSGAAGSNPAQITSAANAVFFVASPAVNDEQLFSSDGTSGGTLQLTNISQPGGANPTNLIDVNGTLFFAANDPTHGTELWKSNGTPGGTALVDDIAAGSGSSDPHGMVAFNNQLYFVANAGSGQQIWKSNGTALGTTAVTNITPGGATSFDDLVVQGGAIYFFGDDGIHGPALWKSNGTNAGTSMVQATGTAPGGGGVAQLTAANNQLFFVASDPTNGYQVWRSDGTAAGTHPVKIIDPGITAPSNGPLSLTTIASTAYFSANDGATGRQLWSSDGTAAGTTIVATINPSGAANPTWLTDVNGTLFFAANNGTNGNELWRSNGASAGTKLVTDINSGPGSSDPSGLVVANGTLYFNANDGTHGTQLWEYQGPPSLTQPLPVINPTGNAFDNPDGLNLMGSANGLVFFDASDGVGGQELWAVQTTIRTATSAAVTSNSPNAIIGSNVQLTATITANGSATGVVEFFDGTTELGIVAVSVDDTATIPVSTLSVGSHSISADYLGDGSFAPSAASAITQTIVEGAANTTHVASSANPGALGTSILFTATVTGTGGAPTGVVDFVDNGAAQIGSATLGANGTASIAVSTLPLGVNSITAIYQGDGIFSPTLSNTLAQTIVRSTGTLASTTLLNADNNPGSVGTAIQFTITVSGAGGSPTGSVDLIDGATLIGSAVLDVTGKVTLSVSSLALGDHPITAIYQGDGIFAPSTSNAITQTIVAAPNTLPSTTAITSSDNPAAPGQTVQFNITVSGAGTPTGGVEIFDGSTLLGSATLLANGQTSFTTAALSAGDHTITAQYQGDGVFGASTSAPLAQTILIATPSSLVPNLSGAAGSLPPSVVGGAKLHKPIPILVTNPTGSAIKQTIAIVLYATANANSIAGGTMIATLRQRISLKPGKSVRLKFKPPTISASLPNGTYNIVAQLTDMSNLTGLAAYPGTLIVAAPFIAPVATLGPVVPASLAPGKKGSITLTVANMGNIAAKGAMSIEIDPSSNGLTAIAGMTLDSVSKHVNIKSGASVKIKLRLTIPTLLTAGQCTPLASLMINGIAATATGSAFTVT